MKFTFDHDYHIHSGLSLCSGDAEWTPERILNYAKENGLTSVCLTDHFWDSTVPGASNWYAIQNLDYISQAKPLPQAEGIEFLFGCETDMDQFLTVGVSKETAEKLDESVFFRSHRSYIINLNYIHDITPYGRWTYVVRLKGTEHDALITQDKYEELEKLYE